MQIKEIKQLIDLMCNSTLTRLELEQNGSKIALERNGTFDINPNNSPVSLLNEDETSVEEIDVEETKEEKSEPTRGPKELTAPMVGVFHYLPNKKVEVGSKLKSGEVCCIIEAMKLMNEITITEPGEIVSIEVNEGDMVEFGQVLFTYK